MQIKRSERPMVPAQTKTEFKKSDKKLNPKVQDLADRTSTLSSRIPTKFEAEKEHHYEIKTKTGT